MELKILENGIYKG